MILSPFPPCIQATVLLNVDDLARQLDITDNHALANAATDIILTNLCNGIDTLVCRDDTDPRIVDGQANTRAGRGKKAA